MLTIFTIPKPFHGHIDIIQRNAIQSWTRLRPACEIVLCGDELGIREVAREFEAKHVQNMAHNEFGTPLLDSAFALAEQVAKYPLMCYVNADIMLLSDFIKAVERIRFPRFLMVGRRWNIDLTTSWDFEPSDWEGQLRKYVAEHGLIQPPIGSDYFVFQKGALGKLPPFAVGRPAWDNWMIYRARALGITVIDATRATTVIHQNHDYTHVPKAKGAATLEGPEADRNRKLMGGLDYQFDLPDATHLLTRRMLLPALLPAHMWRRLQTFPILKPRMKPISQPMYKLLRLVLSVLHFLRRLMGAKD